MGKKDWQVNKGELLPQRVGEWIADDVRVFLDFLVVFVEEIAQAHQLNATKENDRGAPPYDRAMLLAIWLYGLHRGISTCRRLEEACRNQLDFMYLTGRQFPDHTTLWGFFAQNKDQVKSWFISLVRVLRRLNQVDGSELLVDGTTIRSAGSRKRILSEKKARQKLERLEAEAAQRVDQMKEGAENDVEPPEDDNRSRLRDKIRQALDVDQERDEVTNGAVCATDPESRILKLKEGFTAPGYNAQVGVDSKEGMVVSIEATDDISDAHQLARQYQRASEMLGCAPGIVGADSGYHTPTEIGALHEKDVVVICPPNAGAAKAEEGPFAPSRFRFDEDNNCYICPVGSRLPYLRLDLRKNKKGKHSRPRIEYRCKDFLTCPSRRQCTSSAKAGRTISRLVHHRARKKAIADTRGNRGKKILQKRNRVEHRIGELKHRMGVRRILFWGRENTSCFLTLAVMSANLYRSMKLLVKLGDDPVKTLRQAIRAELRDGAGAKAGESKPQPAQDNLRWAQDILNHIANALHLDWAVTKKADHWA